MKTVACVIDNGFAPFEFGVACEAFGLDRSDDGVPNFDFRVVAPEPASCDRRSASRSRCRTTWLSRTKPTW